jgi:hypothetical protein
VLRPLTDVLGLSRLRLAATTDGEFSAESERFLLALGIRLSDLARTPTVTHAAQHAPTAARGAQAADDAGRSERHRPVPSAHELAAEQLVPAVRGAR